VEGETDSVTIIFLLQTDSPSSEEGEKGKIKAPSPFRHRRIRIWRKSSPRRGEESSLFFGEEGESEILRFFEVE
jgi:hypothetical protein